MTVGTKSYTKNNKNQLATIKQRELETIEIK